MYFVALQMGSSCSVAVVYCSILLHMCKRHEQSAVLSSCVSTAALWLTIMSNEQFVFRLVQTACFLGSFYARQQELL